MKDNLKKTIEWSVELGVEIAKSLEDKKFTLAEGIALFDNILKIPNIVKHIKDIPTEWTEHKDSPEYKQAIVSGVQEKVKGLSSETSQALVLKGIEIGYQIGQFIELCIQANKESK